MRGGGGGAAIRLELHGGTPHLDDKGVGDVLAPRLHVPADVLQVHLIQLQQELRSRQNEFCIREQIASAGILAPLARRPRRLPFNAQIADDKLPFHRVRVSPIFQLSCHERAFAVQAFWQRKQGRASPE